MADGGTIFLDEIGDMPPSIQAKLLRTIEHKQVRRVGATVDRAVDVRFIAATHRDLQAMVREGTFRQDLLFRINGIAIRIPPLRERVAEMRHPPLCPLCCPLLCRFLDTHSLPYLPLGCIN
jgi:transcriptional regulator with PAS, ATPase and Fis domain